jgi:hypothetical protein
MCMAAQVPETMGSRAQEDFLVACRAIDPEYGTSGLRALIDLEDAGTTVPSVEDYVSKFTTYLKRVRPLSTGLSSMAAELDAAKPQQQQQQQKKKNRDGNKVKPQCPCGLKHYWVDCWLINTEHPQRPKAYFNAIGQRKLDAALAADPDLRCRINNTLGDWRAKQQENGESISIDNGNRPTKPTANTVRYTIQDRELRAQNDEQVETMTITDENLMPKGNLYTAVSMEEDIDKLSNRWILDPGSNTHVINTEEWKGWTREYNAVSTDFVGAGTGRVQITAWGSMELMANTPTGVRSLRLTHVAYVQGFITSLIGLARCRKMNIHFDSGRDLLYKGNPGTVLAYLEHDGGHWLVDADASRRPEPILLSSFGTTYRPSKAQRPDQTVNARIAHQMWGHPGKKVLYCLYRVQVDKADLSTTTGGPSSKALLSNLR